MTVAGTTTLKGVMRWMAPELVVPGEGVTSEHRFHTKATDVWAFGLVVYVRVTRTAKELSALIPCSGSNGGEHSVLYAERRSSGDIDND